MSLTNQVFPYHDKDLSQLPVPDVYKNIDYEDLLSQRKETLNALHPVLLQNGQAVVKEAQLIVTDRESYWKIPADENIGLYYVDLESDPAARLLEADVWHEQRLQQRVNEAALSTMLSYAQGADLDHIATRPEYAIKRLTITQETDENPAILESDQAFRKRVLLSIEGKATGGSIGWYLFNTLSASGAIKDAYCHSPKPYHITITLLSYDGKGEASAELIKTVKDYITSRYKFPQGDLVIVQSAEIIEYTNEVDLYLYPGPGADAIKLAIRAAWEKYRAQSERIGHWITQSGVDAALHQAGVYRAVTKRKFPIEITRFQAPYCTGLDINEVQQHEL